MIGLNDVNGRSVADEGDNEGVVATMADMLGRVCDGYVGSATLTDLAAETNETICFRLSNPSDRFNLRATSRQLLPTVDGSWRDLQSLKVVLADRPSTQPMMASSEGGKDTASGGGQAESDMSCLVVLADGDDPLITRVEGTMKDPDTGDQSEFNQTIRSAKLMEFLKCVGPCLPSLKLKANHRRYPEGEDYPPISAADGHPISAVLSACADATVMPSVVDVSVKSRRLLCDRSVLDALIRWADHRRYAADHDDTPFWHSLTLDLPFFAENRTSGIERLREAHGDAPADIQVLLDHGFGEVMFDVDDPTQADTPSSRWRKGLKEMQVKKLRMLGSGDPEGDSRPLLSLLQNLMDRCESLQVLNVDIMLELLELRPTRLVYPKTLTILECYRLGKVAGEIVVIVENCPLLESICVNLSSIDNRDIVAVTQLKHLKALELIDVPMELQFALTAFDVGSFAELDQIGPESNPWPMLEEICVESRSIPAPLIGVLINCCSELSKFVISCDDYDRVAAETMLDQLCRVERVTQLHCSSSAHFGERHVNSLTTCCPNLLDLDINVRHLGFRMDDILIPRLLRGRPELRTVYLRGHDIHLTYYPAVSKMLVDIATDVGDRKRRVVVNVDSVVGFSRELLDQIAVGLPPDVRLCHSDFDDRCLHDHRRCWRCCFEDDRPERHSFVIGHSRCLQNTVVFTWLFPLFNGLSWVHQR